MIYVLRSFLLLLFTAFSFEAHADQYVTITQPAAGQRLTALPVAVTFSFTHAVQTGSVSIVLNGQDVTNKFHITNSGGTANLSIEDGIRPSLGRYGNIYSPNSIIVRAKIAANVNIQDSKLFYVKAPIDPLSTTGTIPNNGGALQLYGYGSIIFPAGSFANPQQAKLSITATAETSGDWNTSGAMFSPISRLSYEIRVNTGAVKTAQAIQVHLNVPDDYISGLPANGEVHLFAQVLEDGGEEVLYSFELFDATFDGSTIIATLPPNIFTDEITPDTTFEAVLMVAALPTKSTAN